MKLKIIIPSVFFLFSLSFGVAHAVSLTTVVDLGSSNSGTIDTGSGSDRVVCVGIGGDTSDLTTDVSVGSDTLTLEAKVQVLNNRWHYVFCGVMTVTGSQTITITGGSLALSTAILYSGAGTPLNGSSNSGNGTTAFVSIAGASDSWLFGSVGNDAIATIMGSNTTCRSQGGTCTSSLAQADSNGVASPTALNFTVANNWGVVGVEIPNAGGGGGGGGPPPPPPSVIFATHPDFIYLFASSTCTQVGTSSPVVYNCNASSTAPNYPSYGDWSLYGMIALFFLGFLPLSVIVGILRKRR